MKILINGNPLKAFTSGTPMRGLIKAMASQRSNDWFTILVSNDHETQNLTSYWEELKHIGNVYLEYTDQSRQIINLKKLVGFKNYQKWPKKFDFYFSPGMPEYFSVKKVPSLSIVADLSSINLPESSSLKWHGNIIFKNTLRWAINSNNAIGAISEFTKNELLEKYPTHNNKFYTIHNGIEDFWFDSNYQQNEITEQYKSICYWIWWGFGSNRKNLERLILAYLSLKQEITKLPTLLLVGEISTDLKKVNELIASNPDCIHHIGFQKPYILKQLVKNSQGLVFPSLYEGFGLPIIETYSQGRPVLYGNCTSMPEIASTYGVPVDPYSLDNIKDGLNKLLQFDVTKYYEEEIVPYSKQYKYSSAASKVFRLIDKLTATSS